MPNANRPAGLSPVQMLTSAEYNGQARMYAVLAANTNGFAIGDPVVTDPAGATVRGVPAVTAATAGAALRGVIVGISDTWPGAAKIGNLNQTTRPAAAQTGDWFVMVVDDPDVAFEIQEVGTGTAVVPAQIGLNANILPGANNGFVSGVQLNNVGIAVTSTLQLKILGLVQRADNDFGPYAKWLVQINNHELAPGTTGV